MLKHTGKFIKISCSSSQLDMLSLIISLKRKFLKETIQFGAETLTNLKLIVQKKHDAFDFFFCQELLETFYSIKHFSPKKI